MPTIVIIVAAFIGAAALAGGVAMMFRGGRGTAVEDRLDVLTGSGSTSAGKAKEQESSLLLQPLDDKSSLIEDLFSRVLNLEVFLEQADAPLSVSRFLLISGGLAALGVAGCLIARAPLLLAPVVAVALGALPLLWLWLKRKRRLASFAKQLPEALELIARALRAGHSLASGFHEVAQQFPDPIRKEFARCYEEQNFGIPLDEALESLTVRVPNLDLRFFATAVILQRQTGGDLAEILDKIGSLVRERFKIWGQVQALTGEGRLSGIVLMALPPVLFLVMYRLNPEYTMTLFQDPLGHRMLAFAVVMQIVGALVIRKIVNIKV